MTNLEIVKSTYQGTAEENSANLKDFLDENAQWIEANGFPYAGTYIGFNAIVSNVFKRLATEWIGYRVDIDDYVASGDKIAAYGAYSGTYKETNKYFEARVVHLWQLKSGRVIRMEQFVDSQVVNDAMK
ncbi:ketosteroid isomerase-like protein [Pedobacter sp. UYP24]